MEIAWQSLARLASRTWGVVVEEISREDWLSRDGLTSLVRLVRPIEPFNRPDFAAPLIGIAAVLAGLLLTGLAVSSLSTLLLALLALGFLLTRVFGVSLEIGYLS